MHAMRLTLRSRLIKMAGHHWNRIVYTFWKHLRKWKVSKDWSTRFILMTWGQLFRDRSFSTHGHPIKTRFFTPNNFGHLCPPNSDKLTNVDKSEKNVMIVFRESRAGFETDHKRIFSSDLNLVLKWTKKWKFLPIFECI